MSDALLFVSLVFLGIGFMAAFVSTGESTPSRRHTWSRLGTVAFVLGSAALLAWIAALPHVPSAMVVVAAILIALGVLFWVIIMIVNKGNGKSMRMIRQHIRFAEQVGLPGWKSLDATALQSEDRKAAAHVNRVVNVGAALVIFPGIALILAASIIMNIRGSTQSDFLAHAVGFYTLLIAACWTVSYVLTILLIAGVQTARGNAGGLTLTAVANSLGTWAGLGAAISVLVGSLIPLVVIPLSKGQFHLLGTALLDSVSPALLLNISAAGAVYGFLIGEVVSTVDISSGEQNIYVKATMPPLLFATITSALGVASLTPGRIASALSRDYQATILKGKAEASDPFSTALELGLDSQEGWANVVAGLDKFGWNNVVDHHIFLILTWVIAILVALFSTTIQIRKREFALIRMVAAPTQTGTDSAEKTPVTKGTDHGTTETERPRPRTSATQPDDQTGPTHKSPPSPSR